MKLKEFFENIKNFYLYIVYYFGAAVFFFLTMLGVGLESWFIVILSGLACVACGVMGDMEREKN